MPDIQINFMKLFIAFSTSNLRVIVYFSAADFDDDFFDGVVVSPVAVPSLFFGNNT
jgi:hypothetical protein